MRDALLAADGKGACMGAWGYGSFENDDALDWVGDLTDGRSLKPVEAALDAALGAEADFGISGEAECGSAAAEVVAALGGAPSGDLPEEIAEWIATRPWERRGLLSRLTGKGGGGQSDRPPREVFGPLVAKAQRVVERVMQDEGVRSRFLDEAGVAEWERHARDLAARLGRCAS